jgi:hypothetical protein
MALALSRADWSVGQQWADHQNLNNKPAVQQHHIYNNVSSLELSVCNNTIAKGGKKEKALAGFGIRARDN